MFIEEITNRLQFYVRRQIPMTVSAQTLVLLDEFGRFVVLEVTTGATRFAEYRWCRACHVFVHGVTGHAGIVCYALKNLAVAILAARCR
jgi:hypothetical protein